MCRVSVQVQKYLTSWIQNRPDLSGAEVATQRSFFMTAVVLIAVMVDRRAITFRTLAVAAMIVLVIAPEALVHPSFQMSFAATLGLVALVQIGMPRLFATA